MADVRPGQRQPQTAAGPMTPEERGAVPGFDLRTARLSSHKTADTEAPGSTPANATGWARPTFGGEGRRPTFSPAEDGQGEDASPAEMARRRRRRLYPFLAVVGAACLLWVFLQREESASHRSKLAGLAAVHLVVSNVGEEEPPWFPSEALRLDAEARLSAAGLRVLSEDQYLMAPTEGWLWIDVFTKRVDMPQHSLVHGKWFCSITARVWVIGPRRNAASRRQSDSDDDWRSSTSAPSMIDPSDPNQVAEMRRAGQQRVDEFLETYRAARRSQPSR